MVEELRHEGWTFTYIGANQDVEAVAGSMGIRNTLSFDTTDEGTKEMFQKDIIARLRMVKGFKLSAMKGDKCIEEKDDYFKDNKK